MPLRTWVWRSLLACLAVLLAIGSACAGEPVGAPSDAPPSAALQLDAVTQDARAWPVLRILDDTTPRLEAAAARARLAEFAPPATPFQNLGQRTAAVWLHVPLQLAADAPGRWVARIEYPALRDVELALFDAQGRRLQHGRTGSSVPFADRPLPSRALAMELALQPGQRYDLLVRVQTATAAIVPLTLHPWPRFSTLESRDQITFGLLSGLIGFMLVYSLMLWFSMHQPAFLAYAALLCANTLFALGLYGVGAQYVWPDNAWLSVNVTAASSLLVVAANLLFCLHVLEVKRSWPRLARAVQASAMLALVALTAFLAGLIDYRQCALMASTGAVLNVLLLLPPAVQRLRGEDRSAAFLLLGWLSFAGSMLMVTVLLRGLLPATPWTLYGAQAGAIGEMLSWVVVLNLKVNGLRQATERSRREHDLMHALAHTDALTGLANRRGLELAQRQHLDRIGPPGPLGQRASYPRDRAAAVPRVDALYLLDLDGFKQVNDQLGHEAGDHLLVEVARRLRQACRSGDVLARLGGDEFVLLARAMPGAEEARRLGEKLLAQFSQPVDLAGGAHLPQVGATIGARLAVDGRRDLGDWLRDADAALYAGKAAGKGRLCGLDEPAAPPVAQGLGPA